MKQEKQAKLLTAEDLYTVFHTLLAPRTLTRDQELDGEDILPRFCVMVAEIFEICA